MDGVAHRIGALLNAHRAELTRVLLRWSADKEFFIRKATGWALREYAKTDAAWVLEFVTRNGPSLSPLSRREALKNLEVG